MVSTRWDAVTRDRIWRERVSRSNRPHAADGLQQASSLPPTATVSSVALAAGSGTPDVTPRTDLLVAGMSFAAYSANQTPSPTQTKQMELTHKVTH